MVAHSDSSNHDSAPQPKSSSLSLSFGGIKAKSSTVCAASGSFKANRREAITGIGASGVVSAESPASTSGAMVIPKQEDSFKVGTGKSKVQRGSQTPRHYLPEHDDGKIGEVVDRFEVAPEAAVDTTVTYGLNLRAPRCTEEPSVAARGAPSSSQANGSNTAHSSQRNGQNGASVTSRDWETKAFKDGMESLPEEADADAYAAMPIAEFGAAMMRGMGWMEGQGVGRRQAGPSTPIQYVQRPHRLGLGAQPAAPEEKSKRHVKPGESRQEKQHQVFIDKDGRQKHVVTLDDKLVDAVKLGVHPGKTMHILAGRHEGLACEVLALEPKVPGRSDKASVRLLVSNATVTARCSDLGEKFEADAARDAKAAELAARKAEKDALKKAEKRSHADGKRGDHSSASAPQPKRQRGDEDLRATKLEERSMGSAMGSMDDEPPWLAVNIRVRIIDRMLAKGQLYLKKGTVVDVHQPTVCDVVIDEPQRRISGVHQGQVETLVPKKEGATLLVLRGEHRGQRAKLLHRNVKAGAAAVQLSAEMEVVKVSFDDIADYVGGDHD